LSVLLLRPEVVAFLKVLSKKSEGLVIERIHDYMWSTGVKIPGRGIVIVFGAHCLYLMNANIAAATTGSVGGIIMGYTVLAGSTLYEMRCSEKHTNKQTKSITNWSRSSTVTSSLRKSLHRAGHV
jgi:hypothetical protein